MKTQLSKTDQRDLRNQIKEIRTLQEEARRHLEHIFHPVKALEAVHKINTELNRIESTLNMTLADTQ